MLELLIKTLAGYKELDESAISGETSFKDIGLDSLDIVEIAMDLEDKLGFAIEIKPEITTVAGFADYLEELKKDAGK